MKVLIQNKIEPVDIREIDEDSMMWTLNDSMEINDTEGSLQFKAKQKMKKKNSIFMRTSAEKNEYMRKTYIDADHRNENSPEFQRNHKEKNEQYAYLYEKHNQDTLAEDGMSEAQTRHLI